MASSLLRQAIACYQSNDLVLSEQLLRSVLLSEAQDFDALTLLGIVTARAGRGIEAVELLARAVAARPDSASAHSNYGNVLKQLGRLDEALASYEQAIVSEPDHAQAHYNRGNTLQMLRRWQEASSSYRAAIRSRPHYLEAHYNLGNTLRELDRYEEALAAYDQALSLDSAYVDAHNNRGVVLQQLQRYEEASASFREALILRPQFAEAHNNHGNAQRGLGRLEEARASYERALTLNPQLTEAYRGLGLTHQELGHLAQALECFERALALPAALPWLGGECLNARLQLCDWHEWDGRLSALMRQLAAGEPALPPFVLLALSDSAASQRQAAEVWQTTERLSAASNFTPPGYAGGNGALRGTCMVAPDLLRTIDSRYGRISFFVTDVCAVRQSLELYGEWAENELTFLKHFIRQNETVVDVGAYIGTHSLAFARWVGAGGRVVAFEAQPSTFEVLRQNVAVNHLAHVEPRQAAVADFVGTLSVATIDVTHQGAFGSASLRSELVPVAPAAPTNAGQQANHQLVVPATTIDDLQLNACALIKIDAEGTEDVVLSGAKKTIARFRPIIYAECNSIADGLRSIELLRSVDYEVQAHVVNAFNVDNFRGRAENIFGNAREVALLGMPRGVTHQPIALRACELLVKIGTADDLALALLNKPQYPWEILASGAAAQGGASAWLEAQTRMSRLEAELTAAHREMARARQRIAELEGALRRP